MCPQRDGRTVLLPRPERLDESKVFAFPEDSRAGETGLAKGGEHRGGRFAGFSAGRATKQPKNAAPVGRFDRDYPPPVAKDPPAFHQPLSHDGPEGLSGMVDHNYVERVGREREARRCEMHVRDGSRIRRRLTRAGRGVFVHRDDCRGAGQTTLGCDQTCDSCVARSHDLQYAFTEANAAHRHRQRVARNRRFAQKHAHFLMI